MYIVFSGQHYNVKIINLYDSMIFKQKKLFTMYMHGLIINGFILASFIVLAYALGVMISKFSIKVNYTRNILHFSMLLLPVGLYFIFRRDGIYDFDTSAQRLGSNCLLSLVLLSLLSRPVREKSAFVATCFRVIDRPEDRYNTLGWLVSQLIVAYLIMIVIALLVPVEVRTSTLFVLLLIVAFGDGLAEPLGIRFCGSRWHKVLRIPLA